MSGAMLSANPRPGDAVLVVDDDADLREVLAEVIRDSGRFVLTAFDEADGLLMLESMPRPCVVLLDLRMAPSDGYHFLSALNARTDDRDVHVVLMTADRPASPPSSRFVVGLLRKPFGLEELFLRLERVG